MDNIYSAYHYACKTKADKEAIEQIYEEIKKSAQNAIYRNIGDIFFTARTDTEINGAVECNGGTYSTADFEGKQTIGNLLANGSLPYVSLEEYESLVTTNGSCRAFGWSGGDSFRVPLLSDVYIEAGTALTAGEFIAESLPNITGAFRDTATSSGGIRETPTGAFLNTKSGTTRNYGGGNGSLIDIEYDFDASLSSSTYQDNAKVKPDSVRYRAMVQLASGATDQAVITATSALQQLINKANNDLSNISSNATEKIQSSIGVDYKAGVDKTWGTLYTAEQNGWVLAGLGIATPNGTSIANASFLFVDGEPLSVGTGQKGTSTSKATMFVRVLRGQTYQAKNPVSGESANIKIVKFYPDKAV